MKTTKTTAETILSIENAVATARRNAEMNKAYAIFDASDKSPKALRVFNTTCKASNVCYKAALDSNRADAAARAAE